MAVSLFPATLEIKRTNKPLGLSNTPSASRSSTADSRSCADKAEEKDINDAADLTHAHTLLKVLIFTQTHKCATSTKAEDGGSSASCYEALKKQ